MFSGIEYLAFSLDANMHICPKRNRQFSEQHNRQVHRNALKMGAVHSGRTSPINQRDESTFRSKKTSSERHTGTTVERTAPPKLGALCSAVALTTYP